MALKYGCKQALMKAKSPSCGYKCIYDGTFTRTLKNGHGCTVEALLEKNIRIYTENDIELLLALTGSFANGCSPSNVVKLCRLNRY
ncbi:MAG: DUF523 domain-containing protein [Veillonella parvula]|nr:DUF523 domain-containing protein [Veillonella parvula]